MSKLEQLLQDLCPDGVKFFKLGDITSILRGKRLTKSQLVEKGDYPVYHGGLEPLGYYNENNREKDTVMIINVGASAGIVGYSTVDFWSSDGCFCVKKSENIDSRYLYYTLSCKESYMKSRVRKAGIPTLDAADIEKIIIPLPPVEIQKEIVTILDDFENYNKTLNEELELREKQSNFYIAELLSFDNSTPKKKLDDCCILEKGKTPIQKAVAGEYPLVVTTEERKSSNTYQFNSKTVCIPLVSSRGHGVACLNRVYYQEGKFALGNILCGVTPNNYDELSAEYLYYYLNFKKDILLVPLMKGGANVSLTVDALRGVKVPVPTIEVQNDIVSKLKPFAEYQDYLRKEIEARQKQYEYYRDQLLSFKQFSE